MDRSLLAVTIFNTDQGSQFTSVDFTGVLKKAEISHSRSSAILALHAEFDVASSRYSSTEV